MTTVDRALDADRSLEERYRAMWALGDLSARRRRPHPRPGHRAGRGVRGPGRGTGARRGRRLRERRDPRRRDGGQRRGVRPHSRAPRCRARARRATWRDPGMARGRRRGAAVRRRRARRRAVLRRRHVRPPPLWGSEGHLLGLFGDRVGDVTTCRQAVTVDRFSTPEEFRDYFKAHYGPTVAAYRGLAGDAARVAALDRDLSELVRRHDRGGGSTVMEWEYLLATARRRG